MSCLILPGELAKVEAEWDLLSALRASGISYGGLRGSLSVRVVGPPSCTTVVHRRVSLLFCQGDFKGTRVKVGLFLASKIATIVALLWFFLIIFCNGRVNMVPQVFFLILFLSMGKLVCGPCRR